MAKKNSVNEAQQKLEEAKQNIVAAVNNLSISDERILELRQIVRLETANVKKKKGFFAFLGL
jgi:hypothetical protein